MEHVLLPQKKLSKGLPINFNKIPSKNMEKAYILSEGSVAIEGASLTSPYQKVDDSLNFLYYLYDKDGKFKEFSLPYETTNYNNIRSEVVNRFLSFILIQGKPYLLSISQLFIKIIDIQNESSKPVVVKNITGYNTIYPCSRSIELNKDGEYILVYGITNTIEQLSFQEYILQKVKFDSDNLSKIIFKEKYSINSATPISCEQAQSKYIVCSTGDSNKNNLNPRIKLILLIR